MSTEKTSDQGTGQVNQLEAEKAAILEQLSSMGDDISAFTGQPASVTPEGSDHAEPTEDPPAPPDPDQDQGSGEDGAQGEAGKEGKSRKEKSDDRLNLTWEEVNRQKEEIARVKAQAERDRAEAERLRLEAAERARSAGQFTPDDYDAAADHFESEGDMRNAELARKRAADLRSDLKAAEERRKREDYERQLRDAVNAARAAHPELDDPNNELTKTVNEILANRPAFNSYPNGIIDAVRVAEVKLRGDRVDALQAEVDALKAQLSEAKKRSQPGGDTPTVPKRERGFGSLSLDEQRSHLLRIAAEADDRGAGVTALNTH